jgi:hypothetical protein
LLLDRVQGAVDALAGVIDGDRNGETGLTHSVLPGD